MLVPGQRTKQLDSQEFQIHLLANSPLEEWRANFVSREPETVEWMKKYVKEGDVVYDIGANVGAFTLIAAHLVGEKGKVYAFEPQALNHAALVVNTVINAKTDRVIPIPYALADKTRLHYFNMPDVSWLFSGATSPGISANPSEISQPLFLWRLDEFRDRYDLKRPNVIKVDVDGAEKYVLTGAKQTLKDPLLKSVQVEMEDESKHRDEVEAILKASGLAFERLHQCQTKGMSNYIWSRPG